jgi:hypothetical protein
MEPVDLKTRLEVAEESDVAALLNMTLPSLRNQRAKGSGPPYQRIGRKVFYPIKSLRKYLEASTVTPKRAPTLIDRARKRAKARVIKAQRFGDSHAT